MSILRSILPSRWTRRSRPPSDVFDLFDAPTVNAVRDSRGKPLGEWSSEDAATAMTAPRLILGLLRAQPALRLRFPRALSGSRYRKWLLLEGAILYGVDPGHIPNIAAAFASDPGEQIRQFYFHSAELQKRFPLALLPVGQKKFVKWLFSKGAAQHGFSDEAILWYLHQTAERLPRGIAQTYLINPQWQEQFPTALSPPNHFAFLKWLRSEFPKYRPLRKVRRLPGKILSCDRPGINILAHFCYPSGLQQAALSAKAALESAGIFTSCRDVPAGVKTQLSDRRAWLGLETFPVSLIAIAPVPHFANAYRRAGLHRRSEVYRIASWYWELESVPAEWTQLGDLADEIWAPTPFVAEAMRATMPLPVVEMLPAVSLGSVERISRASLGVPQDHFLFLFMFDMCSQMERKNPLGLIRAFRSAFSPSDKAALLIKISRGSADPQAWALLRAAAREHNVVVIDELESRARAYGYIAACDCFVSLHRSEGFGLCLAEAMLLGKPVIATNYSGNLAFMNRENSSLVDYKMITIETNGAIYKAGNRWADPSEEHAAALMREIWGDSEKAISRAEQARAEISAILSLQAAGDRMKSRLHKIKAGHKSDRREN